MKWKCLWFIAKFLKSRYEAVYAVKYQQFKICYIHAYGRNEKIYRDML